MDWSIEMRVIENFLVSEEGAVTVDWVVLTAAIVGLGFAVIALIAAGATEQSNTLGAYLDKSDVKLDY